MVNLRPNKFVTAGEDRGIIHAIGGRRFTNLPLLGNVAFPTETTAIWYPKINEETVNVLWPLTNSPSRRPDYVHMYIDKGQGGMGPYPRSPGSEVPKNVYDFYDFSEIENCPPRQRILYTDLCQLPAKRVSKQNRSCCLVLGMESSVPMEGWAQHA